jgi:uncharacterized protein YndB with AHSA1/START domain
VIVDGEIHRRTKRLAEDEWVVRIVDAHPAYIDVETYVSNQERLRQNQSRMHGAIGGTGPKEGRALLTGLVLCGRCGKRMRVDYSTHERATWRYICTGKNATEQNICWSIEGSHLDEHVEQLFLSTMVPEEIDLTIAVEKEASGQARTLEAQWKARLEQARYEARNAERRYKAVDPDNRVVARTLEREWEARLQDLDEVERQYTDARRTRHVDLTAADRAALRDIARDLPAVWNAPTTSAADRKAMLRLVIEVVSLEPIDIPVRSTRVRVQWKSGALDDQAIERPPWTRAPRPLPRAILDAIQTMLDTGLPNDQIAQRLNDEGLRRRKKKLWTASAVSHVRAKYKLHRSERLRYRFLPDRHPVSGRYSLPGAARRFGVSLDVVKSWVRRGLVEVHRERYDRYDARWLVLDDGLGAQLANSSKQKS